MNSPSTPARSFGLLAALLSAALLGVALLPGGPTALAQTPQAVAPVLTDIASYEGPTARSG